MEVYGNTKVIQVLEEMVSAGHVPHAILLEENDGGGAFAVALKFLRSLYGDNPRVEKLIHPDIHFVFPVAGEKKPVSEQFIAPFRELLLDNPYFYENELYSAIGIEGKQAVISVNEARSILETLSLSAVEGGYRTMVMYLPEKMNLNASNALLKMLEEPPEKTLFVMITHASEKLLPTISSRCQRLRIQPLSPEDEARVHAREASSATALRDLFHDILDAVVRKDLLKALQGADAVADLKIREQQRRFLALASDELRLMLMLRKAPSLAIVPEGEEDFFRKMAGALPPTFPRKALACVDRAEMLLSRNVNQKILFTDLVNQLYTI